MMRFAALVSALILAVPAFAQVETAKAEGAILRALDTLNGRVEDLTLNAGQSARFGKIEITLNECRYPADNPADDAFAQVIIQDDRDDEPRFSGWMLASSPALNALEHTRYDVWVVSCKIDDAS